MEKVVYILGAGFSAPLGLPVMSNFYSSAKDTYVRDPHHFEHFKKVFDIVDKLAKSKNYYVTDLFNIEEILSILEFQTAFGSNRTNKVNKELFKNFIKDVIEYYTPSLPQNEAEILFPFERGSNQSAQEQWGRYGAFVATLFGIVFRNKNIDGLGWKKTTLELIDNIRLEPSVDYSVITLNYDLVLETAARQLSNVFKLPVNFSRSIQKNTNTIHLAKLHGSIDLNNIVPPTWNKNLNEDILSDWKLAYKLLSEANHIRILGYSLPPTDNYIKYLLRAASTQSTYLKRIDVICLDPDTNVKKRYDEFIDQNYKNYNYYHFASMSVENYLARHQNLVKETPGDANKLEIAHISFDGMTRNK